MRWKFVDRITQTDEIFHIQGEKQFPLNEEWHQDHFPQSPIVPGVLQIEVVANLVGKLILLRTLNESQHPIEWVAPILLKTGECRFKDIIRPKDLIQIEVEITKYNHRLVHSKGALLVEGKERANITISSARVPVSKVGDPRVLIPWKIQEILEVYPDMRADMRKRFEQELKRVSQTTDLS